jgi:hypothetical protein
MIKVFTSNSDPANNQAGDALTNLVEKWMNSISTKIEIISFHTNSNKYGWSLTVLYKIL